MPATEPRNREYPPRNEEKDAALLSIFSYRLLEQGYYADERFIPILNIPWHRAHAQNGTDVRATPIVDVLGEPQAKVVPEAHRICRDVRPHHSKSPAQPREELCGTVVP